MLSGLRRYAHLTALRPTRSPAAAGHKPVLSEGAIRRAFERIEAYAGVEWLQEQLDYTPVRCWAIPPPSTRCMSKAPSSATIPPTRLTLPHLPQLHDRHAAEGGGARRRPARAPCWGPVGPSGPRPATMAAARRQCLGRRRHDARTPPPAYLFRLRLTPNVVRAIGRDDGGGLTASRPGLGRPGDPTPPGRLEPPPAGGAVAPKLDRPVAIEERDASGQHRLSFATIDPRGKAWEFAALVTSTDAEILSLGQLYRDRGDADIDQAWGLSEFKGDTVVGFDDRRRQATPGRRGCPDRLQLGNHGRVGGDQFRAAGAGFDRAAA